MVIRWLHLSDVHECKKEGYHRKAMYDHIVAAVRHRTPKPDLVLVTGDVAFGGKQDEYDSVKKLFFDKLRKELPDGCPIFFVPGNHDVDRERVVPPRDWIGNPAQEALFQEVGPGGLRKREDALLPRFENYRAFERDVGSWGEDWLASETGSICKTVAVGGAKVAMVGINTAWLCHDEDDWSQLTAGRTMVESALGKATAAAADVIVVLGHHPLEAMTGERPWSDGRRIREKLAAANAVYLHGHLHAAGSHQTGDSLQSVLAIQAPSAFQAGDSARWRNGIMWGEIDLDDGALVVEPLKWSSDHDEYKFDTDAALNRKQVEGRNAFRLPLPGRSPVAVETERASDPQAPVGWRIVDAQALAAWTATRPDLSAMVDYFDGSIPSWSVALADGVRPRRIVDDLVSRFRQRHSGAGEPYVGLLTGAGGEGKSSALIQVVAALVRDATQSWTCLHRHAREGKVSETLLSTLEPREGHAWIVAVDDAEDAGAALADALRRIAPRTDVHLLLAAREADWAIRGPRRDVWQRVAEFRPSRMPALDEEDASRIVVGWSAYGAGAMGRLRDASIAAAAEALVGHARDNAARPGEGALLGALLFTRQGAELQERVRSFLHPLQGQGGVGNHDLRDVYAMIAAMHAENQLYLSGSVLASALKCSEDDLDRALTILRQEAMLDSGRTYLLTRHRLIAETACGVLKEDGYDPSRWYPFLVKAVRRAFLAREIHIPEIGKWNYELAERLSHARPTWKAAQAVAKAVFESERPNPRFLTSYSQIPRKTGAPGEALVVLKAHGTPFIGDRAFVYEWSVAAGWAGDPSLSAWLAARSLADDGTPLSAERCERSLDGLAYAFERLSATTGKPIFEQAMMACGRLGLLVPGIADKTRKHLEGFPSSASGDDRKPAPGEDIATIRTAVVRAAEEMEQTNDPLAFERLVDDPSAYRYDDLLRRLSAYAKAGPT